MRTGNVWYDLHCHVLPGIDDGCKNSEESVGVLRASAAQGVCGIIATPHYYPRETIGNFLKRRSEAVQRLRQRMQSEEDELPGLCYGAEVAYHSGLVYEEQLELLCLGKSHYLLLELPFSQWSPAVLRDVHKLNGLGITPVIAHIERYIKLQSPKVIEELLDSDVLIQMNAEALQGKWKGHNARKMLQKGQIHVLASDSHNLTSRPPNLGAITAQLARGTLKEVLETVRWQNESIFAAAFSGKEEIE